MKTITAKKYISFTSGSSKTVSLGANTDKVSQRKMAPAFFIKKAQFLN